MVLEPRRIAARAAAERMANSLGETCRRDGRLCACGSSRRYRTRRASRSSPRASSRGMILDDPELSGIAAVLFDEFHERSLDADLGLALARDCQPACATTCVSW